MPHERCRRLFSTNSTKSVEWLMAFFMLGWAITLSMPTPTFSISSYRAFANLGVSENNLAIFYGVLGTARVVMLAGNGRFARGPEVRFFCSAIGAFTWFVTAGLFFLPVVLDGYPVPIVFGHHIILCAAELYTIGVNAVDRRTGR